MPADRNADSSGSRPRHYPRTNRTQQARRAPLPADVREPTSQNDAPAAGNRDRANRTPQACRPPPPADVREPTSRNEAPANRASSRDDTAPASRASYPHPDRFHPYPHDSSGSRPRPYPRTNRTQQARRPPPPADVHEPTSRNDAPANRASSRDDAAPANRASYPHPDRFHPYPQVNRNHNPPANTPAPTTSNRNHNRNRSGDPPANKEGKLMKYLKRQAVPSPDPSAMTPKQALASCSAIKRSVKKRVEATEKTADHRLTGFLQYSDKYILPFTHAQLKARKDDPGLEKELQDACDLLESTNTPSRPFSAQYFDQDMKLLFNYFGVRWADDKVSPFFIFLYEFLMQARQSKSPFC